MFEMEHIRAAEQAFNFLYPSMFLDIARELEALTATSEFSSEFPNGRLILPADLPAAWASNLPPTLVPFLWSGDERSGGYYCFQKCQSGSGLPVVVFVDHAVVYEWESYQMFLEWMRQACSEGAA